MKKFLGAGGASAFSAALLLTFGASSEALAQVQANLPVVQAVVSTTTTAIRPVMGVTAKPVLPTIIRPAPVAAAPAQARPTLSELVAMQSTGPALDEQGKCLATAVYFESQGEPLEGQLAVANVVINRARSNQYPSTWCGVVKQKAQFSFVRNGQFPRVDLGSDGWRKAEAIARIAALSMASAMPTDVLWYHADYVAPSWRRNLVRVEKIGAHIFYRS